MPPEDQQEFCPHLYDDLRERLRAKDQERAIALTYRLICSGRPLGEIIAETAPVRAPRDSAPSAIAPSSLPPREPPPALPVLQPDAAAGDAVNAAPQRAGRMPTADLAEPPGGGAAPRSAGGRPGSAPALPERRGGPIPGDAPAPPASDRHHSRRRHRIRRAGFLLAYSLLLVLATILCLPLLHRAQPAWFAAAEPSAVAAPAPVVTVPIAPAARSAAPPVPAAPPAPAPASTTATAAAAPSDRTPPPAGGAHPAAVEPPLPATGPSPNSAPRPPAAAAEHAAETAAALPKQSDTPPTAARGGAPPPRRGPAGPAQITTELLVARGDAVLGTGDLAAARLFYRRGADRGDGTAALRLGETFDPAFLRQAGLGVVAGDAATAVYWYRRARDLGNGDADLLLQNLKSAKR